MAVNAIDNSNLKHPNDPAMAAFDPGVSYTYDAATAEVDAWDSTRGFPSGVSLLRTHVRVHDKFGGQVNGEIENPDGSESPGTRAVTIDVSSLNRSKPLDITVTVIGDDGKTVADGGAYDIGAAGQVGNWDKQYNA